MLPCTADLIAQMRLRSRHLRGKRAANRRAEFCREACRTSATSEIYGNLARSVLRMRHRRFPFRAEIVRRNDATRGSNARAPRRESRGARKV